MIPIKDSIYYYFDDGKIRESRKDKITIKELIPFYNIDREILLKWETEVKHNSQLFAKQTDFFVKGLLISQNKELIFARTIDNGWFSFNDTLNDGRLDIDGSLERLLKENI